MRSSERISKSPQRFDPGFGSSIESNSDAVESLVCMTCDGIMIEM